MAKPIIRPEKVLIISVDGVKFGHPTATYSVNNQPIPNGKNYQVNVIPIYRFQGKVGKHPIRINMIYCQPVRILKKLYKMLQFDVWSMSSKHHSDELIIRALYIGKGYDTSFFLRLREYNHLSLKLLLLLLLLL